MAQRILIVAPGMHPRDGGPPRVVYGSAVALARAGATVHIATMGPEAERADLAAQWPELKDAGVPLHSFPRSWPTMIGRSAGLARFARESVDRFDLLHVHCVWETGLADVAAIFRRAGKPVIVSPHGMLDRWQLAKSRFKKAIARKFFGTGALLRKAAAILYGTQEEAAEAAHLRLPGRVVTMPNGVTPLHLDDDAAARQGFIERFPQIATWSRTVLFFSRLHPKKGLDMLVEAFARVQPDFPNAGLLAAAIRQDDIYEAKLRERLSELPRANIILTTDLVGPEARSVFAVADIFALPSHQEGFSIAILEAASAAKPQLITDRCHMQEIAEENAGFVVPASVDGLERGLRAVLSRSDSELSAMGRNGARMVAEQYTWQRIASRLSSVYGELIGKAAA